MSQERSTVEDLKACELCDGRGYRLSEDFPHRPMCAVCKGTGEVRS